MAKELSEVIIDDLGSATDLRTGAPVSHLIRNVGPPRYIVTQDPGVYEAIVRDAPSTATAFSRGKPEKIFGFKVTPVQYLAESDKKR